MRFFSLFPFRGLLLAALLFSTAALPPCLRAVILYGTGDPTANTTAPTGSLANSGWQYEGQFGGFLGTPIAPHYFITASHIGFAGSALVFQGVSYPVSLNPANNQPISYKDSGSDLMIYQIDGTFPTYAPIWNKPGLETGKTLLVTGRGTQRGTSVLVGSNNHLGGWQWGAGDGVQRWGQNTVAGVVNGGASLGNFVYAGFDSSGGPNEGTLSAGDSGGAVFIQDIDGAWKLAGINYGVDSPFYRAGAGGTADPSTGFYAAMFDTTGIFEDDGGTFVAANNPGYFYSTEIAGRLTFIYSVIGVTPVTISGNDVIVGFLSQSGKTYRLEQSPTLGTGASWTTVADNLAGTGGRLLVTDTNGAAQPQRFYRVVTLP